ncbi:MAG: hypothetical protein M3Z54_08295 [Gemmatimonadota bacterium]|nr:hypothetical protein [Gemmatimonadota bacterium]
MFADVSQLSIVDDDGTQYTLNIAAQEIKMSDGRVLELNADQTALAIEAFYGVETTDPVAYDVASITYGPLPCSADDPTCCPHPDTGCYMAQFRAAVPQVLWRRVGTSLHRNLPRRRGRGRRLNPRDTFGAISNIEAFSFASARFSMSDDVCGNIAGDAVSKAQAYFNTRTSFIKDVWPLAVATGAAAIRRSLPMGSAAAAKFGELIANHEATRITVNVMAFFWNSYGCSSRSVSGGTIVLAGGSSSGGSLSCSIETWGISFDDGKSWHNIDVRVCQYMA